MYWGTWVAQLVKHLPSIQAMIQGSWGSPMSGTGALSREPASPSPSVLPPACALLLCQIKKPKKINPDVLWII